MLAPQMGAGEAELVSKEVGQQASNRDGAPDEHSVDSQLDLELFDETRFVA
jgi:hypothetical protein